MRILVVGAGAVGGYFGGRLLEAGRDVTFLVRARRAAELERSGLRIRSRCGDANLGRPATVVAADLRDAFDLVILSCKAYDLASAIADFRPAVGEKTAVLPLLNGLRHLEVLDWRIGAAHVLGGQCAIGSTVNADGEIVHLNEIHSIAFGERDGARSARVEAIARAMEGARFESRASEAILQDMWEKWVFLSALAGATCLMRAAVGDILASPGGREFVAGLLEECSGVAEDAGYAPRAEAWGRTVAMLTQEGSNFTASMLRDIERGGPIEGEHIIGDLIGRARAADVSNLRMAYTHLKAYEARRAREK
jgi:2-dehydropantoate 2-reductase